MRKSNYDFCTLPVVLCMCNPNGICMSENCDANVIHFVVLSHGDIRRLHGNKHASRSISRKIIRKLNKARKKIYLICRDCHDYVRVWRLYPGLQNENFIILSSVKLWNAKVRAAVLSRPQRGNIEKPECASLCDRRLSQVRPLCGC